MSARLVVLAVAVLALAAFGDAVRRVLPAETRAAPVSHAATRSVALPPLVAAGDGHYRGAGAFLHQRVVRGGRVVLGSDEVERAFPVRVDGPLDISKIALAPDGTLVLAVYRFPSDAPAVGALEFWRGHRLVGAFEVPPGWFGGGLAFDRTGRLVATFSYDGQLRGVFDRRGRPLDGLPDSFLNGD